MTDDMKRLIETIARWEKPVRIETARQGEPRLRSLAISREDLSCLLNAAKASILARNNALEQAASLIEGRQTNNVGMVHPIAIADARAIRDLKDHSLDLLSFGE